MRQISAFAGALVALLAVSARAQNAPPDGTPTRIRGTVEKLEGQTLQVKSRDGQSLVITLAPNVTIAAVVKRGLADIKAGDYVPATAVKCDDGKLHAIEVHIFPEAMRGTAEGQFPWDLVPDSLMTNATVAQVTAAPQGQVMKVNYKGSEAEVTVPPGIPIVGYVPADAALLKPGTAIFIVARKQAEGTLTAASVNAEKAGVKPPM